MATFARALAETDCCGNLSPLHDLPMPAHPRRRDTNLAATAVALAARALWTLATLCAWSGVL